MLIKYASIMLLVGVFTFSAGWHGVYGTSYAWDASEDDDDVATGGDITDPDVVDIGDMVSDYIDGHADEDEASGAGGSDSDSSEPQSE